MDKRTLIRSAGLSAVVVLLSVAPAAATIIGGAVVGGSATASGKFIKLSVPLKNPLGPANSVGENTFDLPNLYGFDEDQNIVLKASLTADVGRTPVPAGAIVASHYIFFDPGPSEDIFGTVDFDARIVAIITSTSTLAASDFLAHTGVHYLNPSARGLEPEDSVTISGPNQITFNTRAANPGDYVRVLTEFSPRALRITSSRPNTNVVPAAFADPPRVAYLNGLPLPRRRYNTRRGLRVPANHAKVFFFRSFTAGAS